MSQIVEENTKSKFELMKLGVGRLEFLMRRPFLEGKEQNELLERRGRSDPIEGKGEGGAPVTCTEGGEWTGLDLAGWMSGRPEEVEEGRVTGRIEKRSRAVRLKKEEGRRGLARNRRRSVGKLAPKR